MRPIFVRRLKCFFGVVLTIVGLVLAYGVFTKAGDTDRNASWLDAVARDYFCQKGHPPTSVQDLTGFDRSFGNWYSSLRVKPKITFTLATEGFTISQRWSNWPYWFPLNDTMTFTSDTCRK